jgi:hypothetical protein
LAITTTAKRKKPGLSLVGLAVQVMVVFQRLIQLFLPSLNLMAAGRCQQVWEPVGLMVMERQLE